MVSINKLHLSHCFAIAVLLVLPHTLAAEVLVVVGADSHSVTMGRNQVSDVFLGKVVSLPDGTSPTLIDLPESDPLREEFYMKVANKTAAQAKAHWAKLYFTGRGVPPQERANSDDVKKTVNSTPGGIGYIAPDSLDSSVQVVFVVQ